jgi:phage terminase large subunit
LEAVKNKYKYTKAYYKIRDLILDNPNEDVFVICGGQGASKTVSIIQLIIQSLHSSPKEATVLSSELSKMKRTVMRDYTKICQDWGIMTGDSFNKSESKHEWTNGSYIDFLGADVNDVGKGFRRDILYINEADKLDIDAATQFISRANLTIIDYNPDNHFWGDDYINENNFLRLTFEDNEFLSESEVKSILNYKERGFIKKDLPIEQLFESNNIMNKYWANKWRVYGLGLVGSLSGTVFNNWSKIDNVPPDAELLAYGLDWGYSQDPTCLIAMYKWNGKLIIDELIYRKGLINSELANIMRTLNLNMRVNIVADSAEPKSIADLKMYGFYNVIPAVKGADSVRNGINKLQEHDILITSRSTNTINEFQNYTWAKDRNGKETGEPIDAFNHAIDPARYVALTKLSYQGYTEVY